MGARRRRARLARRAGARAAHDSHGAAEPAARCRPGRCWLGLALLLAASASLEWTRLYQWEGQVAGGHAGGVLGYVLGSASQNLLGFAGSGVLWIAVLVAGISLALRFSWLRVAERIGAASSRCACAASSASSAPRTRASASEALREREELVEVEHELQEHHLPIVIEPPLVEVPKSARVVKERQKPLFKELADTKLPQVDLLDSAPQRVEGVSAESLEMTSRLIEKKLKDFGVEVRVVAALARPGDHALRDRAGDRRQGRAGRQPGEGPGALAQPGLDPRRRDDPRQDDDGARAAEREAADDPPLGDPRLARPTHDAASQLTLGLGKDIVGNPVVADLAKMPHCLVAGTTGAGKSVGINAMILSLLYKAEARDVRLILIDPKMLEMSVYEGIPHLLCPVVTDMKQAANALNWGVGEMERRYKLMSKLGVRNLVGLQQEARRGSREGRVARQPVQPRRPSSPSRSSACRSSSS